MMRRVMQATPRWTKFFLAAAALWLGGEARAMAGCGDHTFVSFRVFDSSPDSGKPRSTTSTPQSRQSGSLPCNSCPTNPLSPTDEPCRGPFCSSNNLPPGLPVTSMAPEMRDQSQTMCLFLTDNRSDEEEDRLFVNNSFQPVERTDSIFHPPRHG
jgi:acetyl esterase/lipase